MTFVEKPKRPYPPPGQEPPPTLPRWSGNQRSHQNEDLRRKQNPGNNSANRSNFSWSRQNKNMSSQPFKPLTCFYCRKDGHMISNCPEKLKMKRQQHNADSKPTGFIGLALSVLVPLLAWNPLVASLPLLVFARSWLALRCFNCSSFVACFFLHWLHCKVKKFLFQAISLYFEVSSTSSHSEGYRLSTLCHVESRVGWDLGSSLSFPSFLSVTFSSLDFGEHIKSCANSIAGT